MDTGKHYGRRWPCCRGDSLPGAASKPARRLTTRRDNGIFVSRFPPRALANALRSGDGADLAASLLGCSCLRRENTRKNIALTVGHRRAYAWCVCVLLSFSADIARGDHESSCQQRTRRGLGTAGSLNGRWRSRWVGMAIGVASAAPRDQRLAAAVLRASSPG